MTWGYIDWAGFYVADDAHGGHWYVSYDDVYPAYKILYEPAGGRDKMYSFEFDLFASFTAAEQWIEQNYMNVDSMVYAPGGVDDHSS